MIPRTLEKKVKERLTGEPAKIIIIYGQRQVGKTTLAKHIFSQMPEKKVAYINADTNALADVFSSRDLQKLKVLIGNADFLFIDEAQRIPNIGINLKIIFDHLPNVRILATGSSSLDLANQIQEPLTGRTWTFQLHPLSAQELSDESSVLEYHQRLEEWLIFGCYPGVIKWIDRDDKIQQLSELAKSYLYKDLLEISDIKYSRKLRDLLRMLSFQIGSEVSYHELGRSLQMDTATVQRYIDLLEKTFVIKTVEGYSRNLRKEITKKKKIYFYDLGVRNALIERFSPLEFRDDKGALWENFLYMERMKLFENNLRRANRYFWRLQTGAELDLVEEADGKLSGFEFKFGNKKGKAPASWLETYPEATYETIDRENYLPFILNLPERAY